MEEKKMKVVELFFKVYNPLLANFFDLESDEMLEEKIEVLTELVSGKTISEIPNFYGILERYPKDEEIWD